MKLLIGLFLLFCLLLCCLSSTGRSLIGVKTLSQNQDRVVVSNSAASMLDKDRSVAQHLLDKAGPLDKADASDGTHTGVSIGTRMKVISGLLLKYPYVTAPLKGSLQEPERFVTRMDGFDCVTFVETVLALSGANSIEQFLGRLREVRYTDGEINYTKRLHYATDWHKANVERGILEDMTKGEETVECVKTLNLLKGFQPRKTSFRFFPKSRLTDVSKWLQDGDLIYFVTARNGLDIYHLGMVFREDNHIVMRHAARSQGKVVEQDLADFFKKNQMQGFIIARPKG